MMGGIKSPSNCTIAFTPPSIFVRFSAIPFERHSKYPAEAEKEAASSQPTGDRESIDLEILSREMLKFVLH